VNPGILAPLRAVTSPAPESPILGRPTGPSGELSLGAVFLPLARGGRLVVSVAELTADPARYSLNAVVSPLIPGLWAPLVHVVGRRSATAVGPFRHLAAVVGVVLVAADALCAFAAIHVPAHLSAVKLARTLRLDIRLPRFGSFVPAGPPDELVAPVGLFPSRTPVVPARRAVGSVLRAGSYLFVTSGLAVLT
jgi:hypothetical protein